MYFYFDVFCYNYRCPNSATKHVAMWPWVKFFFWHFVQKKVLISASCFHATSHGEYKDIRRLGFKQPVSIIPNGIDFQEDIEKIEKPFKTLLFFGRIHPIKGIENLLHAWAELQDIFPNWQLATQFCQQAVQDKISLSMLRVSNAIETQTQLKSAQQTTYREQFVP